MDLTHATESDLQEIISEAEESRGAAYIRILDAHEEQHRRRRRRAITLSFIEQFTLDLGVLVNEMKERVPDEHSHSWIVLVRLEDALNILQRWHQEVKDGEHAPGEEAR